MSLCRSRGSRAASSQSWRCEKKFCCAAGLEPEKPAPGQMADFLDDESSSLDIVYLLGCIVCVLFSMINAFSALPRDNFQFEKLCFLGHKYYLLLAFA